MAGYFCGMPVWELACSVVNLDTGEERGPFSRSGADAGAAFLKLPQGCFEVVADNHPLAGRWDGRDVSIDSATGSRTPGLPGILDHRLFAVGCRAH